MELLVVVAIIAIASAGVVFAVRDSAAAQLEREAARLASLLESARARSRASGLPVRWVATEAGFRFDGVPPGTLPDGWLGPGTRALGTPVLLLGPEPVIGAQEVLIASADQPGRVLRIATDGLHAFAIAAPAQQP